MSLYADVDQADISAGVPEPTLLVESSPGKLQAYWRLTEPVAPAEIFHALGLKVDVWTLDAETPRWRERLARVVAAGVDIVTTNTARAFAAAGRAET